MWVLTENAPPLAPTGYARDTPAILPHSQQAKALANQHPVRNPTVSEVRTDCSHNTINFSEKKSHPDFSYPPKPPPNDNTTHHPTTFDCHSGDFVQVRTPRETESFPSP